MIAALAYSNPFVLALVIIAVGALIYWFVGYLNGPQIFRHLVIGVVIVALLFLTLTLLTGCETMRVSGRLETPIGNFDYSKGGPTSDGKTVVESTPSPTPKKGWFF